ncbi:hypothetical protein EST38_g5319 [Candolleomyces aberdarensis]|uniref:Uncharacterized protein n=1 Tax=Candolleomyces aberdarensis TaxID=2316362 RepID=A0A4Q2DNX9_9AGAR|nr:hypothetical protein EST38_g5319 [Candolleomyces aberdarensis]
MSKKIQIAEDFIEEYEREEAKARLEDHRSKQVAFEKHLAAYEPLLEAQESAFEALIALYPPMVEDLGHRRAERLDTASKMSQTSQHKREASLNHISRSVRRKLEDTKRNAHEATDSSALIKTMKQLVRF